MKGLSIVLVEPENPDNIGAVARAMKNTALEDLRLVRPPRMWKSRAKKMAVGAFDLFEKASVFDSLSEAVADCHRVIGTTRRHGSHRGIFRAFSETIKVIQKRQGRLRQALLFGKESKGLSTQDISLCDWMTTIPASPVYPSINLAQAIMIFAFSLYRPETGRDPTHDALRNYANKKEILEALEALRPALIRLGYPDEGAEVVQRILDAFHRMAKRGGLLESEARMLKGLGRRICVKITPLWTKPL